METFTNLGPIVDMVVVDLERQGQGQVICHPNVQYSAIICGKLYIEKYIYLRELGKPSEC